MRHFVIGITMWLEEATIGIRHITHRNTNTHTHTSRTNISLRRMLKDSVCVQAWRKERDTMPQAWLFTFSRGQACCIQCCPWFFMCQCTHTNSTVSSISCAHCGHTPTVPVPNLRIQEVRWIIKITKQQQYFLLDHFLIKVIWPLTMKKTKWILFYMLHGYVRVHC